MPIVDLYPKIPSLFRRFTEGPNRNKFDTSAYATPELEQLVDNKWTFTEKVDGTNIRVHWDGYRVTFGGRTDNAQIPAKLIDRLRTLFPEELFEQAFTPETPVTLYGEGHGAGIQAGGGKYGAEPDFVLFDVKVGPWWLRRPNVEDVARKLGISVVPVVLEGTLTTAVRMVENGLISAWGNFPVEGLVGVPVGAFLSRSGERIMVKLKTVDFR